MGVEFEISVLTDYSILEDFTCGIESLDEFIHTKLKVYSDNHYCVTYWVKNSYNDSIIAVFSLSFDSIDIDEDLFDDMRDGASSTSLPDVDEIYREEFESKFVYPALEISFLAVNCKYQNKGIGSEIVEEIANKARSQLLGGCIFLSVKAMHNINYSTLEFYKKCKFSIQTPVPNKGIWPMFRTIWV